MTDHQRTPRITRTDLDRLEHKLDHIIQLLRHTPPTTNGPRTLPDGTRFLPGTGTLDQDPNRPRSPELQAAIAEWERDHP